MSKNLFGAETFSVCVGELADALAAMKPLGKHFTTVELNARGVRGRAVTSTVEVRLHWVEGGGPKEGVRVDRLFLLEFLKGAPDGALIHFEAGEVGTFAEVVKHGVNLTTRLPQGSELLDEVSAKWEAAVTVVVDPVGAAAFFRAARFCREGEGRAAMTCVRVCPFVVDVTFVGTDGRRMRAEEARLVETAFAERGFSVPPLAREVLAKWGRWKESRVEFAASATLENGCEWLAVSCGGLRVEVLVEETALKFPEWRQVLDGYGEPWIWRVPQSERERLAALVPVMPPASWVSGDVVLRLECEPGVTEGLSVLRLSIGQNVLPVRAELVEQPAGAGGLSVQLNPAFFLDALAGGVEEILLRESEGNDGEVVLFRGPGVKVGVMPLRDLSKDEAGETASVPKEAGGEGEGATVTIKVGDSAPVTVTAEAFSKAVKKVRKARGKKGEAGDE